MRDRGHPRRCPGNGTEPPPTLSARQRDAHRPPGQWRRRSKGRAWAGSLLALALRKAYESANSVGACMVIVDAIDERAARFYAAHGFVRLPESMRLILPMRMIEKLLTGKAPLFDAASHCRPTRPRPIAEQSRITIDEPLHPRLMPMDRPALPQPRPAPGDHRTGTDYHAARDRGQKVQAQVTGEARRAAPPRVATTPSLGSTPARYYDTGDGHNCRCPDAPDRQFIRAAGLPGSRESQARRFRYAPLHLPEGIVHPPTRCQEAHQ